jgi:stage II sporulation protein P
LYVNKTQEAAMRSRRQRKQRYRKKWRSFGVVLALLVIVSVWGVLAFSYEVAPASTVSVQQGKAVQLWPQWRDILSSGIPGFIVATERPAPVTVRPQVTVGSVLRRVVVFCTGIDVKDLRSLLRMEIPVLGAVKDDLTAVSALNLPDFPKFDWKKYGSSGQPLVGIYHTHTSESYTPSSGVDHAPGGQAGDIVAVGEALVKRLAQHGIPAIQSKTVHDYPSFMKAYGPSEVTAKKMLAENPSIQMLFDIHRDADKRENTTVMVNGVTVAKVTIIVATGQPDLVQPHWQQNYAFAKLIDAKLNQHYPGLSRGIQLVEWRFNQHLHPRALLLEIGCQENTKEEAIRSAELLGDVLVEILAES